MPAITSQYVLRARQRSPPLESLTNRRTPQPDPAGGLGFLFRSFLFRRWQPRQQRCDVASASAGRLARNSGMTICNRSAVPACSVAPDFKDTFKCAHKDTHTQPLTHKTHAETWPTPKYCERVMCHIISFSCSRASVRSKRR